MSIPKLLNDLLDYDHMLSRTAENGGSPTYICAKKGAKEKVWAACSLLGLIVDHNVAVVMESGTYRAANTYIFAPIELMRMPHRVIHKSKRYVSERHGQLVMVGVEGRFNLNDLHTYFHNWEEQHDTNSL